MRKQKIPQPFTLSNLIYLHKSKKLLLNPEYQRDAVWGTYQKQLLIDSILRDVDIPKLYFKINEKKSKSSSEEFEVVDGQQRLRSVFEFFGDKFALSEDSDDVDGHKIADCRHSQLPTDLQMSFQNKTLDVVKLAGYSSDDIEEMFLRLQNGTPLNAPEKRRAIPGSMKTVVKNLSKHRFFKLCGFKNKRYSHEDIVAKLLHLILNKNIVDVKPNSIRKTYNDNARITSSDSAVKRLKKVFNFICRSFKGKTSPKLKRFEAITLPYSVYDLLGEYDLSVHHSEFADCYLDFEDARAKNEELSDGVVDADFIQYSNEIRHDSVAGLTYRHEFLKSKILAGVPDLKLLDADRLFSDKQKQVIWRRDNGICQICKKECDMSTWHADHIISHSKGGLTSISNGQVLCHSCNSKKNNK